MQSEAERRKSETRKISKNLTHSYFLQRFPEHFREFIIKLWSESDMYSFEKFNMWIFKYSLYDFFNTFVVSVFPISNTVNLFQPQQKEGN